VLENVGTNASLVSAVSKLYATQKEIAWSLVDMLPHQTQDIYMGVIFQFYWWV